MSFIPLGLVDVSDIAESFHLISAVIIFGFDNDFLVRFERCSVFIPWYLVCFAWRRADLDSLHSPFHHVLDLFSIFRVCVGVIGTG